MSKISATMTIERDGLEIEVGLTGTFVKGEKEVRYLRNGDPGHPGTNDEMEDVEASLKDGDEIELSDDEYEEACEILLQQVYDDNGPDDEKLERIEESRRYFAQKESLREEETI